MAFALANGLHVEEVDGAFLVLVPGRTEVLQLVGQDAQAFILAQGGVDLVPENLVQSMAGLIELGVVTSNTWSRRRVIQLGGAAAAAAVAVVALPSVAAAGSTPTTLPPTTGDIAVHINLKDGTKDSAQSPVRLPATGTETAYFYSTNDRTTPAAGSTGVYLPPAQTYVDYTFTGVAPGSYYVDIQQPFDALGFGGFSYLGTTYYVDWNFGHSTPPVWLTKTPEYQAVTVTAGNTANVTVDVQVILHTTPGPW